MNIAFSDRALKAIVGAPPAVRKAFHKQIRFLEHELRHPSLQAKKYDESRNLWQARINLDWRFYFTIEGDTYRIQDVTPHPK
jgi:mRNA-degrading endonuclease RelE of RelBE toxin-antitoxin system